jgi:hypothetical protein
MTSKEQIDIELVIKLYAENKIYTPSQLFEISDKQEINRLIANNNIMMEQYSPKKHSN